ncbi:phosphoenolpyruvate synthase [Crenobacter cavernae]|uniref:Phosphoenolpyruvate synthase n=1 Tax=Crenobacter cavernae TaxID=2290923 RepID=A0A345Y2X7_9NEIS|nr:phosphoenolpyruvate synthase [Crenobacter cavernae]AXK38279.1 phosphoenolpyruvate synthase [Crenobacter cavernae]
MAENYVIWFEELRMSDVEKVGGKNASLGEMISQLAGSGVRVPGGFATTADAYRDFLAHEGLADRIEAAVSGLDIENVTELARVGKEVRQWIVDTPFPAKLEADIAAAWDKMTGDAGSADISVAVRSSATAEDLPDASFAGQQETFLNIKGLANVKDAMKHVFASLYNDRAIAYRVHKGFEHAEVALSAGIQRMVRSDSGAAGVMFTIDTESGFDDVVFVTSSYGLGETVVQGAVNPDEFYVHKPTLKVGRPAILRKTIGSKQIKMEFTDAAQAGRSVKTVDVSELERKQFSITDAEVEELAQYALIIEKHYGRAMDIEWGRDGVDGKLYILQARPETVKSQEGRVETLRRYRINHKGAILATGRAIGQKVGQGVVRLIKDASEMDSVKAGDVLVTDMTDPDWEPVMKRAAAIVTNRGGRTCHAAIIARELGIPAVVGCGDATELLAEGMEVTVSCAEGDTGNIYEGLLDVEVIDLALDQMPASPVKIMMNVGNPELAFDFCQLPNEGVGLARMEFVINRQIGIHPKALLEFDKLPADLKATINDRIAGYASPVDFYVDKLAEGIATLAAAFYPKKVIVRMSDFKSNEYANLIGGQLYEPHEENPMIGFRGAARYVAPAFRDCFDLECRAMKKVRDVMGLTNVEVMIPFVRTLAEAEKVVEILAENGLKRGENGLRLIMMCELPTNAVLADKFLQHFDGFSIGSNDMTQLTLGVDRDSGGPIASTFDERNEAVKALLSMAIKACRAQGKYVGICGQGPSDHPDFAKWLVEEGIETISLNPDTVVETWIYLAKELNR